MKSKVVFVVLGAALALTACGSKPVAGEALAQQACLAAQQSAPQAAQDASQAAAANPKYDTLSADVAALAAQEGQQDSELSDGDSSDDSGLGALANADSLGSGSDFKVITDCVSLGLSVTQH